MSKKYAYFLGCITPLRYPGIEVATRKVMNILGVELQDMERATCCPAPGVFGSFDLMNWLYLAARNLSIAEQMGLDIMVTCNGCYGSLQEAGNILKDEGKQNIVNKMLETVGRRYEGKTRVKHIIDVLKDDISFEEVMGRVSFPLKSLRVATHYGCHYLKPSETRGHGSPERPSFLEDLVVSLDADNVAYKDSMMCCGAGGGVRSGSPDTSLAFTKEKVENIGDANADCIVTPCAFCHFQFDAGQFELESRKITGKTVPTIFVTQLLGLALGIPASTLGLYENKIQPRYLEKLRI